MKDDNGGFGDWPKPLPVGERVIVGGIFGIVVYCALGCLCPFEPFLQAIGWLDFPAAVCLATIFPAMRQREMLLGILAQSSTGAVLGVIAATVGPLIIKQKKSSR